MINNIGRQSRWTSAPLRACVGAARARPTSHTEHKQLGAESQTAQRVPSFASSASQQSFAPGKLWSSPTEPSCCASDCSLSSSVLFGAAKVLINAVPDGELWWAQMSAAANPHMPKEITFSYCWQRPGLKMCNENKNDACVTVHPACYYTSY